MPSLLRIPWISQGWTPAGGARNRFFKGKLPKAIRVISPFAPPFSEQLGHQLSCSPTEQFGSSALLLPPRNSLGNQPSVPPPGTIWVISPNVLPVFGTARTPLKGAADPPVGQTGREEWEVLKVLKC